MGIGAYNRGSMVVSGQIAKDYDFQRKENIKLLQRSEEFCVLYDQFSRNAQDLYHEAIDESTSKGLLLREISANYQKNRMRKSFILLLENTVTAHNAWVNADRRYSLEYMQIARQKAIAWYNVLGSLNKSFHLPFNVPNFGV